MSIPTELGVSFTKAEIDTMQASVQSVIDIIRSKKRLNLSNKEREKLATVNNRRATYVSRSINNYAVDYPNINGLAYPVTMAVDDFDTYAKLLPLLTKLTEAREVTEEMHMLAGHLSFKFMKDQYHTAKRYLGDNVVGAQVVYDGLKTCFSGQGAVNSNHTGTVSSPKNTQAEDT